MIATTDRVGMVKQVREPFSDKERVYDRTAGYADEIHFKITSNSVQKDIEELQAGAIDAIGYFPMIAYYSSPDSYELLVNQLLADPDIEMFQTGRFGFGHLTFNCDKYPTNYTELRVAFAHALDKEEIQVKALYGESRPLDSPVPPSLGKWSLDNQEWSREHNYYDPDPVKGNQILDAHDWDDREGDSWREDPFGNPVEVEILDSAEHPITEMIALIAQKAFTSIGIKSVINLVGFDVLTQRVDQEDFSLYFAAQVWGDFTVPFNLGAFHSVKEPIDQWFSHNKPNFSNTTYDALVDTMFESYNLTEVEQACWDAQKILWYEQPLVPVYMDIYRSFYRTYSWTGWVNDYYPWSGPVHWSFVKTHLKPAIGAIYGEQYENWKQGGQLTISFGNQPSTNSLLGFNPILGLIYDNYMLFTPSPSHPFCPSLAKDWLIEELDPTNPMGNAREGDKQKITLYLHEGLDFHDGHPLTTEDVAYSFELVNVSCKDTDFWKVQRNYDIITHIEMVNSTVIEIYFDRDGLFNLHLIHIIVWPKHIWKPIADAGNALTWDNPEPIGSGPYKWKKIVPGVSVVLERNDDYFYNPRNYQWINESVTTTTTTTTSEETTTSTTPPPATPGFEVVMMIATVITLASFVYWRKKRI
jgi:ABC-type transport system substrate-binding protein